MIQFNKYYNHFNIISTVLITISLVLLIFKGLNFGIDFKGGTLIELRSTDNQINVSTLRDKFNQMDLGDVSVKKFGNDTDYLIKFENKDNRKDIIEEIKINLDKSFGNNFNFRRVENVGPKIEDPDWVIWAAWADRITFEEIEKKTGYKESDVIKIMRRSLKPSSFRLWRKRVNQKSIKHRKKFEYSRKQITSKIKKGDYI